ncbi:hypothetical protein F5146DRAFT_925315 [Armillaria mellea]|nr:hypothetical protein F5146DRAFT_925315 [Armillaria mellea]
MFPSSHGIPSGWSVHVHPQGLRYYVHEMMFHASVNTSSTPCVSLLRVFTNADIIISEEWGVLSGFMDNIVSYMYTKEISLPPKVDLFLGLKLSQEGTVICSYYFADHVHRSVFWLDDLDARTLSILDVITTEPSHLAHAIEARYWHHCRLFPACQEMTSDTIEEVKDFLLYCITGKAVEARAMILNLKNFSETIETVSTARYGFALPELQQYLNIPGSWSVVARLYPPGYDAISHIIIARIRYMLFYGEPGVDRGSGLTTDTGKRSHTPLIALLSPLLFFAPDVHCVALQGVWYNGVPKTEWSAFIQKLSAEWQELIINATVLLNANIAFLAIQSIDNFSADKGRSPAQIASYISTIVSVGSICLGLLLLQRYRHKSRVYTTLQVSMSLHGLETLAIMYSLPWALLMWAMICFLTAFCLMCFTASGLSVRMIAGSALSVISLLILWYLTISRERYEQRWYVQLHALLVKAWNRLHRGLSVRLLARFNMNWTKRMPRISFNDVEMAPMGSHTKATLVDDESTACS